MYIDNDGDDYDDYDDDDVDNDGGNDSHYIHHRVLTPKVDRCNDMYGMMD